MRGLTVKIHPYFRATQLNEFAKRRTLWVKRQMFIDLIDIRALLIDLKMVSWFFHFRFRYKCGYLIKYLLNKLRRFVRGYFALGQYIDFGQNIPTCTSRSVYYLLLNPHYTFARLFMSKSFHIKVNICSQLHPDSRD